ncbi:MAG: hypothetical protein AB7O63_13975 [Reyranellaceae bacterium]
MRLQPFCFLLLALAPAIAATPLLAADSRPRSQASANYAFAGTWSLVLDCPAALQRQLPPISLAVSGPRFTSQIGDDGQASGRIVDGRLALSLAFTTDAGESIEGELVLNERGGAFHGGGLLTGFAAGPYGGAGGQGDRQCVATMSR